MMKLSTRQSQPNYRSVEMFVSFQGVQSSKAAKKGGKLSACLAGVEHPGWVLMR